MAGIPLVIANGRRPNVIVDAVRGESVGTLIDVLQYGSVDTYVFRTRKGNLMAPALKAVFVETDVENKRITVDRERLEEVAVLED